LEKELGADARSRQEAGVIISKIETRLKQASRGDRMYERPMTWEDADAVIAHVRWLETNLRHWREEVGKLHSKRDGNAV
jgi:hypothetical protein